MNPELEARLRAAPLTYVQVGASARGEPVDGYGWFSKTASLRRRDFEAAANDLLTWRVQARSGLRVSASDSPLQEGTVVDLRLGPGRLALGIPCRVVEVIDEPDSRGFAYGTLPGHPVEGEERFELTRKTDGSLAFTVSAFSKPVTVPARLGGPISRAVQDVMTNRYLRALDR